MESRIALLGIIVEDQGSAERLNQVLHEYREYVVARMGVPYPKRKVSVISVVVDAPNNVISSLSGKLGMIPKISIKTVYSQLPAAEEK